MSTADAVVLVLTMVGSMLLGYLAGWHDGKKAGR